MMNKPFHTTLQSYTVLMRCCGSYMHTLCNKSYLMTEEIVAGSSVNSVCGYKRVFGVTHCAQQPVAHACIPLIKPSLYYFVIRTKEVSTTVSPFYYFF